MTPNGFFHNAHEVYSVKDDTRTWVASFATEGLALQWIRLVRSLTTEFTYEVVPV